MKKNLLFVAAVYFSVVANAQIQFGVKAGANFSILHTSSPIPEVSYRYTPNVNAGTFISIPLAGKFILQPELMYSAQGSRVKSNYEDVTDKLTYINIPVLLQYKITQRFYAEIGPQAGYLLSARKKVHSTSLVFENQNDPVIDKPGDNKDIKNYYKSASLSGVIGIGYLSSLNFGIDVRYAAGLTNIAKPLDVTIDGNPFYSVKRSYKNNTFQVDIFYVFGKHKKRF